MDRPWIALVLAFTTGLASARVAAQDLPTHHAHHHVPGRLAAAVAQGSSDEVVLPVTEVRLRRRLSDRGSSRRGDSGLCLHPPVEVRRLRGSNAPRWVGALTDCTGRPTARAMAALALLAQPSHDFTLDLRPALAELRRMAPAAGYGVADDVAPPRARARARDRSATASPPPPALTHDAHTHDPVVELVPGVRAIHPRLLQMLQQVVTHFPGHAVEIVSGYRPSDGGPRSASRHAHARALDFRLVGVGYEALRDFARTLPDAGVGYYPNSVFIHLDVRDPDEGRAFWADYSGPGETPRYRHWPPTDQDVQEEVDYLVHEAESELDLARQREGTASAP